jgi:hypothetical protein
MNNRLGLGLLLMVRNPVGTILFLIAGVFLFIPLAIPFLAVYLLIKLLEVLLAKKPAAPPQLEARRLFPVRIDKW